MHLNKLRAELARLKALHLQLQPLEATLLEKRQELARVQQEKAVKAQLAKSMKDGLD
jgi:hypothetical protein